MINDIWGKGERRTVAKSEVMGAGQNEWDSLPWDFFVCRIYKAFILTLNCKTVLLHDILKVHTVSTSTTLFTATGSQSYYTASTGLLLASASVLPSYVTIFYHTVHSSTLTMEAAGSSEVMVTMKLHGNTYQRTVILHCYLFPFHPMS
jgi:hypothetical protein